MDEINQIKPPKLRGGPRPGSGRKPGSVTKKTREIADKAAAKGITPLEVIIEAMWAAHAANKTEEAVRYAIQAAPYMHAKISTVEMKGGLEVKEAPRKRSDFYDDV